MTPLLKQDHKPTKSGQRVIGAQSERDLIWYFGLGEAAFEGGGFGAVLERQSLYAFETTSCQRCAGAGFLRGGELCAPCQGSGVLPSRRITAFEQQRDPLQGGTQGCRSCRGVVGNRGCKECGGEGFIASEMVWPSRSERPQEGYVPDYDLLGRYAAVSRRLARMNQLSRISTDVLRAYYGPVGEHWGRTRHGRLFAVYPLTPTGNKFVKRTANTLHLPEAELLHRNLVEKRHKLDQGQASLIASVDDEARVLLTQAAIHWDHSTISHNEAA